MSQHLGGIQCRCISILKCISTDLGGADPISNLKLHVRDVVMELSGIKNLWYILGILLGVQKDKLDQIQAIYGSGACPHERCLIKTICQWQDNRKNVTWSSIVQALCSMQKKQIAERIATKHSELLMLTLA